MEGSLALLQSVQDAYASRFRISMVLMDAGGNAVTQLSEAGDLSMKLLNDEKLRFEWSAPTMETSIVDMLPGLKAVVSPIPIAGQVKYYIWAGVLIERESRPYLYKYIEAHTEQPVTWKAAIENLPDTNGEKKQFLLQELKTLSEVMGRLLPHDQKERQERRMIEGISKASGLPADKHSFDRIIQAWMSLGEDLDFAGFATKSERACEISHLFGGKPYEGLLGTRFSVGEGFLGSVLFTGQSGSWNQIMEDPRSVLFLNHNIQVRSLAAFPVLQDDRISGVLFGGSCRSDSMAPNLTGLGQVFANLLGAQMMKTALRVHANQQIQKLNALMEICQFITSVQDVKKIALMLVDMSLNILQANFSAFTIFSPDSSSEEIRIVSRGMTTEMSRSYARTLVRRYREKFQNRDGGERPEPSGHVLEWGEVLECPVMNRKFYGVLAVDVDGEDDERKAFLSSLATIGAIAMQLAADNQHDSGRAAACFHEAMGLWKPEAYAFTNKLTGLVLAVADDLEVSKSERMEIEQACLLSQYPAHFLSGMLPHEKGLHRIMEDYEILAGRYGRESGAPAEEGETYGTWAQIMALVSEYIHNDGKLKDTEIRGLDRSLAEKFKVFMLRGQVIEQEVSIDPGDNLIDGLSNREQEVLNLVVEGCNNKQIAKELFISEHTVKNHMSNIFGKLGVSDRAGVMAYFYNHKMKG